MTHPWLDALLGFLADADGSDLHIKAGTRPRIRVDGHMRVLPVPDAVTPEATAQVVDVIMPPGVRERFASTHEADFAYSNPELGRFRVNAYLQRGSVALVLRRVRSVIPTLDHLGMPEVVRDLADNPRGLVLVTGPTGSGKTTTLAAVVDRINRTRECNIVTIEDPVEYLHQDDLASVSQREVGTDTDGFAPALRAAMRQDPDVILVGEMRDLETVEAALTAAETGHLVLSTLHTIDSSETVNRIVDVFPPHQQRQARSTLAGTLRGVVSQRLIPKASGPGRVPAVEVMVVNGRVQASILEPQRATELAELVSEGDYYGMRSFDQSLYDLFEAGTITLDAALGNASRPHDLRVRLERAGLVATGS
ncbi:MAG: type IV pilus twitching motility protein PilT [Acidimicrobiales bacterium]